MSLGIWSPVRSQCPCSRFSQARIVCERSFILVAFGTRFGGCHPSFFQLLVGHTKPPVFAIVPDLVPVQLHEQPPELLLQFLKSRSVAYATLDPSRSSRQSRVGDLSRRSAVSFLELCAPHQRSPLPNTTRFSNSSWSSSRTRLFGSTNLMRDLVSL